MAIPLDLNDWTYATVEEIVRENEFEPDTFDFKEVLNVTHGAQRDSHNASICRTACSMANTGGGYILFGVKDIARRLSILNRISGIPAGSDWRRDFGNKMAQIQPSFPFTTVRRLLRIPHAPGTGVFVVHIPESPRRPHMYIKNHVFYRRGAGGTAVEMDFYEVRDQMLLTEDRHRQVALLRLELRQIRDLASNLQRPVFHGVPFVSRFRFDTSGIRPVIATVCALLPDDAFLSMLLSIVQTAQFINAHMDAADKIGYSWAQGAGRAKLSDDLDLANTNITANLPLVEQRCNSCEQALESLYGPLVISP